jgi:dephospho-CoA kinase
MARKPVIGLVGGIGSGKTTVAKLLAERGGLIVAADSIAHEALRDPRVRAKILARFGPDVIGPDGEVDRRKLGSIVFADEGARRDLESWVHPWVRRRAEELIAAADLDPQVGFIVLDAAVMLEAGWRDVYDQLIFVEVPRPIQLQRLQARGWTAEEIAAREQAQWPLTEKARWANAVIHNGGTLEETGRQIDELLRSWNLIKHPTQDGTIAERQ